ncbi:hypothetical protein GCM10027456_06350 [Kineosporia babensis]
MPGDAVRATGWSNEFVTGSIPGTIKWLTMSLPKTLAPDPGYTRGVRVGHPVH